MDTKYISKYLMFKNVPKKLEQIYSKKLEGRELFSHRD
jgi:hypothetical protein